MRDGQPVAPPCAFEMWRKGPMANLSSKGLLPLIVAFLEEHLPRCGRAAQTVNSYRDSLKLFLCFLSNRRGSTMEALLLEDITAAHVESFLAELERTRGNSASTQNTRLAAVRMFVRFAAAEDPRHLSEVRRVLLIPFRPFKVKKPMNDLGPR